MRRDRKTIGTRLAAAGVALTFVACASGGTGADVGKSEVQGVVTVRVPTTSLPRRR